MPFLCIASIILIIILLYVFLAKIQIVFEYKKYPGEKLYTDIKIIYGFINLTSLAKKYMSSHKGKKDISSEKHLDKIKKYKETLKILFKVYSENRWFIRNRIHVEKLNFHLKFGLNDAAATGIMTGAVNSLLYWLLAFINQIGKVKNHYFEVVPVFNDRGFASESRGCVTFRMINMLTVIVRLYLTYKKVSK